MGMDIYAGTLTRYYAQNWKTAAQQFAEENGWGYQRIMPEGTSPEEGEALSPAEIQADMEQWRDWLLKALTPEGGEVYAPWLEDNEWPYYTDKPDWDGFGALLLYAAAGKLDEPLPPTVEKGLNFNDHPLIAAMQEQEGKAWSLFSGATCWLPIENGFYFTGPMPNGNQAVIGTSAALRAELEIINGQGWQADDETILSWTHTEGYPADGTVQKDGTLTVEKQYTEYPTESLAKYAFSIFWRALRFSEEHKVPILMDY